MAWVPHPSRAPASARRWGLLAKGSPCRAASASSQDGSPPVASSGLRAGRVRNPAMAAAASGSPASVPSPAGQSRPRWLGVSRRQAITEKAARIASWAAGSGCPPSACVVVGPDGTSVVRPSVGAAESSRWLDAASRSARATGAAEGAGGGGGAAGASARSGGGTGPGSWTGSGGGVGTLTSSTRRAGCGKAGGGRTAHASVPSMTPCPAITPRTTPVLRARIGPRKAIAPR